MTKLIWLDIIYINMVFVRGIALPNFEVSTNNYRKTPFRKERIFNVISPVKSREDRE